MKAASGFQALAIFAKSFFFSIYTYTHVHFDQLHENIQNKNKIYKNWNIQKQSLDIKLLGISKKQ